MVYTILTCLQSDSFSAQDADAKSTYARNACIRVACTGNTCAKVADIEGIGTKNTLVRDAYTKDIYFDSVCIRASTCFSGICIRAGICSSDICIEASTCSDACIKAANIGDIWSAFLISACIGDACTKGACLRDAFTQCACIENTCNKGAGDVEYSRIYSKSF